MPPGEQKTIGSCDPEDTCQTVLRNSLLRKELSSIDEEALFASLDEMGI